MKAMQRYPTLVRMPGVMLLLVAFAWAIYPPDAAAGDSWRIAVREAAVVDGEAVTLREIASPLPSCPAEEWAELSLIPLWRSPAPKGATDRVFRDDLAERLRYFLGTRASRIQLPDRLTIQRGGRVVAQDELLRRAANFLTDKAAPLGGERKLRDWRLPAFIFMPEKTDRIEVRAAAPVEPGHNSLRFQVVDGAGGMRRSLGGSVMLDVWKAVPVAARPINRREQIGPQDVTFVRKNLAYLRSTVWDGRGGPWRTTTAVGTSQVLYLDALEPMPVVTKGDTVALLYEGRLIKLKVPAEVMEDGGFGEVIAVQNLQSKREVYATVRDNKTVVVQ